MTPYLGLIKIVAIVSFVALTGYLGYDKIYSKGYAASEAKYTAEIQRINAQMERSKTEVEILSDILEAQRNSDTKKLQESLDAYLKAFRNGKAPVTVITPEGVCKPSPEFVAAHNEIIRRANAPSVAAGAPAK